MEAGADKTELQLAEGKYVLCHPLPNSIKKNERRSENLLQRIAKVVRLSFMQYRLRHPSFVTLPRATFSQGPGEG